MDAIHEWPIASGFRLFCKHYLILSHLIFTKFPGTGWLGQLKLRETQSTAQENGLNRRVGS